MLKLRIHIFAFFFIIVGCDSQMPQNAESLNFVSSKKYGKEALLLTRFQSFEEFKSVVQIEYLNSNNKHGILKQKKKSVILTQYTKDRSVSSVLKPGVSELDFSNAKNGGLTERLSLLFKSPYAVFKRNDLQRAFALSRRRHGYFGEDDVAFYDLAEKMAQNISISDKSNLTPDDLSEKGYLNTFNHVTAQSVITSIFSEKLADLIADSHERYKMPELIEGSFSVDQINDINNGPTDNYLDLMNNEWGQELGKELKEQFKIDKKTTWTPDLLSNYLNEIQNYYSWVFEIGFDPFSPSDEIVKRFAIKLNKVMETVPVVI